MRWIVEALTIFDWITPLKGFIEDAINDPTPLHTNSWVFFIPYGQCLDSGWNAAMIEQMLHDQGIKYWGSQITSGKYFFRVPKDQARWAEYLLGGMGVPIDPISAGAPAPGQQTNSRSFIDALRDTFGL